MRLIDADAFKEYVCNAYEQVKHMYPDGGEWARQITEDFCKDIDEQPTIDISNTSNTLGALDCVSRQYAIELVKDVCDAIMSGCNSHYDSEVGDEVFDDILEVNAILTCNKEIRKALKGLPSAQPVVIRCRECKYAEVADSEDSQDGYTCQFHRGSIWFSGSYCSWAERRTDE